MEPETQHLTQDASEAVDTDTSNAGTSKRVSVVKSAAFGVLLVIAIFILIGAYFLFLSTAVGEAAPKEVVIAQERSADHVLERLNEEGASRGFFAGILFPLVAPDPISPGAYELSTDMSLFGLARSFNEPSSYAVVLEKGMSREEVSERAAAAMDWSDEGAESFSDVYTATQWRHLNAASAELLGERFGWNDETRRFFLTRENRYRAQELDFLSGVHIPGTYKFEADASYADVAAEIVRAISSQSEENVQSIVEEKIAEDAAKRVNEFVMRETELLPDLAVLPPMDLELRREAGVLKLRFSTTYYNKGDGPLELLAADAQGEGDTERTVYQKIYGIGGEVRRQESTGRFFWHEKHLHYHFTDFVDYQLNPVVEDAGKIDTRETKATFCVRDISKVDIEAPAAREEAAYMTCGKEKQGVSVGWGDTYFHSYQDQYIDVTDLPSGRYTLSFEVNPEDRFAEVTKENNTASALLEIDTERATVKIVSTEPAEPPAVEHVHKEQ